MKTETCIYSGYKIHPGHGKRLVRSDGKVQIFLSKKCQRSYRLKRNPRDIPWTVLYRRKHKKGVHGEESTQKKRTRRVIHVASRAVGNVSLEAILAKRNQKPEFRHAQREAAIKAAKEAQRAAKSEKKAASKAMKEKKAAAPKMKAPKPVKAAQPRVGGKR
ncbi:60S ribosomal protein L24 [Toxocara canis]|uniref:Large ribosomal subunit protein eL24 n=1 Tax=Toxocara canis TaxID=6265 RepID=A0A0B2VPL1_TOXCA|nr:60S ribosomal protein L24 [Toxocara canis]